VGQQAAAAALVEGVRGLQTRSILKNIGSQSSIPVAAAEVGRHLEVQELLEAEEILAHQILVGLDQQQHQAQVQMW
jgi:hypothetical protein